MDFCVLDRNKNQIDDALISVQTLMMLPQLKKEYELQHALYEIGQILCREKMRMMKDGTCCQEGLSQADIRRAVKKQKPNQWEAEGKDNEGKMT